MHDPVVVLWGLPLVAAWVPIAFFLAVRAAGVSRRGQLGLLAATGAWIALTGALAWRGVFDRWTVPPPLNVVLVVGAFLTAVLVASPNGRRVVDRLPLVALVAFHTFRLPLELVMHEAARAGIMPPQMTFTGWNFDIVTGATAPVVAFGLWRGWWGQRVVVAWNVLGFALLAIIVGIAVVSTPVFAAFGSDPAHLNTWIARAPYVWLPTVCVLGAFGGHLAIWRAVMRDSMLFGPWLSAAAFVEAALSTVWSRATRGPHRPTWTLVFEIAQTWLRDRFRVLSEAPPALVRRHVDVVGSWGGLPSRATWAPVDVAGLHGAWCAARERDDRVLFYVHGGGYVFGSLRSHRALIASLAQSMRARALAFEYALAPEHPLPSQIGDARRAWDWLMAQGVDPDRVVIAGDSAGGGLALALLIGLRDEGARLPAGAVLLSPWTDLTVSGGTIAANDRVDYLGGYGPLTAYARLALGQQDPKRSPASPLFADLRGLPPMLVLVGGAEVLLDDSLRVVEAARAAGVDVTLHVEADQVHVYPMFGLISAAARDGLARAGAWARARVA